MKHPRTNPTAQRFEGVAFGVSNKETYDICLDFAKGLTGEITKDALRESLGETGGDDVVILGREVGV
jgi:hypothetical protein